MNRQREVYSRWTNWEGLLPYKEQLIDMELELMTKYHYPDRIIPRSYPEERVQKLEDYLSDGSTFLWISTEGTNLLGYYWAYISVFIDKKRWNLRSIMFKENAKGIGLGTIAIQEGLKKAKELNCYDAATEYVPWNSPMENLIKNNGYEQTRIEVVKVL